MFHARQILSSSFRHNSDRLNWFNSGIVLQKMLSHHLSFHCFMFTVNRWSKDNLSSTLFISNFHIHHLNYQSTQTSYLGFLNNKNTVKGNTGQWPTSELLCLTIIESSPQGKQKKKKNNFNHYIIWYTIDNTRLSFLMKN